MSVRLYVERAKLALQCQSAEELGHRLRRRYERQLQRQGVPTGRAPQASAEDTAALDRLLDPALVGTGKGHAKPKYLPGGPYSRWNCFSLFRDNRPEPHHNRKRGTGDCRGTD
jgi:hypothetical protein